jgi:hypothetical protein
MDQHTAADNARKTPEGRSVAIIGVVPVSVSVPESVSILVPEPDPVVVMVCSSEINLMASTIKTVPTTTRILIGFLKMRNAHTTAKRGNVLLTGTVLETPIDFNENRKRRSPRKYAKNAEKINQNTISTVIEEIICGNDPFRRMTTKNPTEANPLRIKFPDQEFIVNNPFLYTEALKAQQNAAKTARNSPLNSAKNGLTLNTGGIIIVAL